MPPPLRCSVHWLPKFEGICLLLLNHWGLLLTSCCQYHIPVLDCGEQGICLGGYCLLSKLASSQSPLHNKEGEWEDRRWDWLENVRDSRESLRIDLGGLSGLNAPLPSVRWELGETFPFAVVCILSLHALCSGIWETLLFSECMSSSPCPSF